MPNVRRTFGGLLAAVVALLASAGSLVDASGAGARRMGIQIRCAGANALPGRAGPKLAEAATLCLLNGARAAYGLRALRANAALGRAAGEKVADMLHLDYFADIGPTGLTPRSLILSARYISARDAGSAVVGQNIAWGTGARATPGYVVRMWMASPEHRRLILDGEFRDAGVAADTAVPALLHPHGHGATYAIELARR